MSKIPGVSFFPQVPTFEPERVTSIPIFLGNDHLGFFREEKPEDKPILLTVSNRGIRTQSKSYLFPVIKGFFDNGGQRCYVIFIQDHKIETFIKALELSETIENADLICAPDAIICAPDANRSKNFLEIQKLLLEHCEKMGDRFAILDSLDSYEDPQKLYDPRKQLNSSYGALYTPWLKVESEEDPIPPCGHVAGIYALSDQKIGVHGTPANYPLVGVVDVSFPFSDSDQIKLNSEDKSAINWIRMFPGRGIRIWGGKTLSKDLQWQYINVRRLFIAVRRWIELNLADTVFEPNDDALLIRLKRELTVYCESLHKQGALQGISSEEAYYIKCSSENNSQIERESGQVLAEIGLAPIKPGEFIELHLVELSTGITVS